jgi:two-component system, cell cycle sensor histidine kinase and response regulator CckA
MVPNSSAPTPTAARTRDWKGPVLLLAFVGVVVGSLWVQRDVTAECQRAATRAVSAETAAIATPRLLHFLSSMYSAGLQAAGPALPRQLDFVSARAGFTEQLAVVENNLSEVASTEEMRRLNESASRMIAAIEPIVASGRSEALEPERRRTLDEQFREASSHYEQLENRVEQMAHRAAAEHTLAQERADRVELIVLVLLLAVVGVSAFVLWRLARRLRAETQQKGRLFHELWRSESKYRSIFDNAIEGIFQTTPDGRLITANRALARMYGYESPEQLIANLSDISTQIHVAPGQRAALLNAFRENDSISDFELEVQRADGRLVWLSINVHAVRDEQRRLRYLEGTVEDVSDRWWAEQRRRLQYATARVLSEAASVVEARPKILKSFCEILEWKLGAVWDVDETDRLLRCVEIWHAPNIDVAEFDAANTETTYPPGQGLAGEVWQSGEPKWIANLAAETGFANAALAVKVGMGSAYGVPIKVHGEVRHVLEFFSPTLSLPDPELLQTLTTIGHQLGHLIERKSAEELLRRSEMRKTAILHSALDCIISFDADGRITEFNPAAEQTFGYRVADVLGRPIMEVIVPESLVGQHRHSVHFVPTGEGFNAPLGKRLELEVRRKNGTEFPAEIAISQIVMDSIPIYTAYLRDISERKAAERITSELAAVVANSNDAIVACTLDGVIRSWNLGAEHIFGYLAAEVVGRSLQLLFPPDRLDEFPRVLATVRRGESLANYETVRLRKDGRKISVSLTDSPIRGEGGPINGVSSIARDITERKRLEEELLQSQKMDAVGRLAGGIAHDFNNILTAILGYSDLLLGQIEEGHRMYKHLSEVRKAAEFASSLTHQLLAFSRHQPLFLRVFNINDSVRNMHKMLQRVIGEHIQVKTELRAELGQLKADPGQLEQVLLNLCVNARDAMPKGGTIEISTEDLSYFVDDFYSANEMPSGEYVKLSVVDTGVGIPPEIIKHIFEPFFTTKEKGQGTGLGLATCYGIVKQTGGYISVDSTVGQGTTFSIYLLRVDESGEQAIPRKEIGQLPRGNETILYVEDEITVRSLTAHVLRRLGYTVIEACDAKQARAAVAAQTERRIDMLFSDVVLPDLGGKELSDWVKALNGSARILFTSGYSDENVLKRHGLDLSTAFLQKPFTPADLAKKVREVMDGSN